MAVEAAVAWVRHQREVLLEIAQGILHATKAHLSLVAHADAAVRRGRMLLTVASEVLEVAPRLFNFRDQVALDVKQAGLLEAEHAVAPADPAQIASFVGVLTQGDRLVIGVILKHIDRAISSQRDGGAVRLFNRRGQFCM